MRLPPEYVQLAYRRALLMAAAELMQREYLGDMNARPRELSSDLVLAASARIPEDSIYEFIAELETEAERAAAELGRFTLIKREEEHDQDQGQGHGQAHGHGHGQRQRQTKTAPQAKAKPKRKAATRKPPVSRRNKPDSG